jgi:hypothetical protein
MKPYFETSNGKLYNCSCFDFMPEDKCDAILTDPPYGIGKKTGTIGKSRSSKTNYDCFEDSDNLIKSSIAPYISKLLLTIPRAVITPGPKCFCYYPRPTDLGMIYQPATCGMSHWGRADCQPIFIMGEILVRVKLSSLRVLKALIRLRVKNIHAQNQWTYGNFC